MSLRVNLPALSLLVAAMIVAGLAVIVVVEAGDIALALGARIDDNGVA